MAKEYDITTGEQNVTTTGAITGTLNTASMSGAYTVKIRVRGLAAGQSLQIALEDTANSSAFSDALQPFVQSFTGEAMPEGDTRSVVSYQIPTARFGATNTKFRLNAQVVSGTPANAYVYGWLEQ